MGYKQIDGNKSFLIHESGKVRQGLRNLPPDSDRFIYQRKKNGEKANAWPRLIISLDTDGTEDKRLLPELVLKHHGKLPPRMECSPEDFEAKDGNKLNVELANIKYVGSASPEKSKAYAEDPDKKPEPAPKETPAPAKGKKAEKAEAPAKTEPEPEAPEPEEKPSETGETVDSQPEPPQSDLAKGSKELSASEAVKVIKTYDFEELKDSGFLSKDEDRVTVEEAWKSAEKAYKESMSKE